MDAEVFEKVLTIAVSLAAGAAMLSLAVDFIAVNYRGWKINRAPVETARSTVYWKNPEPTQQLLGRHSSMIYYITFHTDNGNILTLYLNAQDYFSLQEGDTGLLTWQADRFWKFIKED